MKKEEFEKYLKSTEKKFEDRIKFLENKVEKLNKLVESKKKIQTESFGRPAKIVDTYWCYFLLGSNKGYDVNTHIELPEVLKHISNFQEKYWKDSVSVNVTPNSTIIFKDYNKSCYRIEAINYPRFPKTEREIYEFMLTLMEYLALNLDQERITLVTPSKSIMIENIELIDKLAVKQKDKTVLYLHGFKGEPNPDFMDAMNDSNLKVIAPQLHYEKAPVWNDLSTIIEQKKPDIIIGHSLGGYLAYYLSQQFGIPTLMLAPAFGLSETALHDLQPIPTSAQELPSVSRNKIAVIGAQDEELNVKEVENFLEGKAELYEEPNMGHDIPLDIFNKYLKEISV